MNLNKKGLLKKIGPFKKNCNFS